VIDKSGNTPSYYAFKNAMLPFILLAVKGGCDIYSKLGKDTLIDLYGNNRLEELTEDDIDEYGEEEAQSRVLPLSKKVQHKQIIISAFTIEENWRRRKAFMICLSGSGYTKDPKGELTCCRDSVLFHRDLKSDIMSFL